MARWKARSAGPVGSLVEQQPFELEEGFLDRRLLRGVAADGGEPGRFDLDRQPHFEHVERDRILAAHVGGQRAEHRRDVLGDEDAGALARLDQAVGGKLGQRLADDGAADAEGLGQLAFGRQFVARQDLARLQLLADRRDDGLRELGLASRP